MTGGLLVGTAAVLVLAFGVCLWHMYRVGKDGGAIGLGALAAHTVLDPIFWLTSMVVFLVSYRLAAR